MKFSLFLALLVLLAAANVHGQQRVKTGGRKNHLTADEPNTIGDEKTTIEHDDKTKTKHGDDKATIEDVKDKLDGIDGDVTVRTKTTTNKEQTIIRKNSDRSDKVDGERRRPSDRKDDDVDDDHKKPSIDDVDHDDHKKPLVDGVDHDDHKKPLVDDTDSDFDKHDDKKDKLPNKVKPGVVDLSRTPIKTVHVHGSILLVNYRSSLINSVEYNVDGSATSGDNERTVRPILPFARDFLARGSRVTVYVSTSKTTDPKLAFAKFPISHKQRSFPLTFELDIDLPDKQRGVLERADITLYFFVYITDADRRLDTFLPAGVSQILLQGTNRNIHPLEIFVRANGLEVTGLFRGRFGQRFIQPGTVFQVLIVDEKTLLQKSISTTDAISQLTISNIPAMFPVPFSLLVHYQMLRPNTKYYALGYVIQNGIRRLVSHEPIWLISEQRLLVTPQLIFTVVPSPFILKGSVTRSMPGSFIVQPGSSLGLNLRVVGSNEPDIVFRIPEITMLPQFFQINVSESARFDPSQNYEITAQIVDRNNNIYMISSQPIPILDDMGKITIPVDDYLYYVQVRLQSSTSQELTYIPTSTCRILLTETPEVPSKPIVSMTLKNIDSDFRDFTLKIPTTSIQRNRNYYLVMMIEINGIITHVSKTLLISNSQRPPLIIQLPVLSLNVVRGVITDIDQRQAEWTSSSYARLFLIDETITDADKAVVQSWKIHLENDFPIRFEVELDFHRLNLARTYRLQAIILNGKNLIEYKVADNAIVVDPRSGIRNDVRISVRNVKTTQLVHGLININGVKGPLPKNSGILIQLSTTPSLDNPRIVEEIHLKVENRTVPIDFDIELPLKKFDINAVYYFIVRYTVGDSVIIPASQVFAFSPRNQATVVITLSRSPQIVVKGQVTSTGSALELPTGSTLHLYITDNRNRQEPFIYAEVFLQATPNSIYEFSMLLDSIILQKKIPLYLRADIIYQNEVILRMPQPALLQLTSDSTWHVNLVIDLPTLVTGEIVSVTNEVKVEGEFDAYIQVIQISTKQVIHTVQLRVGAKLPQKFRFILDNDYFIRNPGLKLRVLIKNCKEEILYESSDEVDIHIGLNLNTRLFVAVKDRKKLTEVRQGVDETAPLTTGRWTLVISGVSSDIPTAELVRINDNRKLSSF